ncbi:MAG: TolC family protein [Cytophagaceae bacterium]|jgi:outer membrane protein TolC|nr:TolC family protein [Cytophagaceae bacterium]
MIKVAFQVLVILFFLSSQAQDSLKVMPVKDFVQLVREHHPMMQQADLMQEYARREVGVARGNFDPKYDFDFTRKVFKGTTYYDYLDHGLKIPTWIGADIKAGFEKNSGVFVNPTNFTPPSGLLYFGVDIPIGKGLWMDERRALVRQAQAAAQLTEGERRKLQIKFMSSAIKDYLDWALLFQRVQLLDESIRLAEIRKQGICERVIQGDLPSIDSVEAITLLNDRLNEWTLLKNALDMQRNKMELYLWSPDGLPLELESRVVPQAVSSVVQEPNTVVLRDSIKEQHPEIIKLRAKVSHYKIEQAWRRNEVLPGVIFSARYLNTPDHSFRNDFNYAYTQNNYKIMVGLAQPLFIRKEINKMKLSAVKYAMAQNDLTMAARELNTEFENALLGMKTWETYQSRQTQNAALLRQLLDGEQSRFQNGESTVFLINSRETKWLEGASKQLESKVKYEKALLEVYTSAGVFPALVP